MGEKNDNEFRYRIIKNELDRYKELLNKAETQKDRIPHYKSNIDELKKWIKDFSVCECCDGLGSARFDGNNVDCSHCKGTGVQDYPPFNSKFD